MADNIELNAGSDGATIRTDDDGSAHWQYVKLAFGADNTQTIVTTAAPVPVDIRSDNVGGFEVVQDTAADLNVTEASASDILTAVQSIDDAVYTDDADWTDSTSKHLLVGGVYQSSPQTITDGDVGPIELDANGRVIVSPSTALDVSAATVTVDATGSGDVPITLDSEVVAVDATGQGDVPVTLDSEVVAVDATGQGDIPVTLDGEAVVLGASDGTDIGDVDVASMPADTFVAEDGALGKGVLLQGDDGTDRHNVAVDTSGQLQIDIAADSSGGVEVLQDTHDDLSCNANVQVSDTDASATNPLPTQAQLQSSHVYDGTTRSEVKHFHTVTSTSDTAIISAVAGKKFRILSLTIVGLSATATNVHLETKTSDNDCFGDSTNPIPVAIDADGDNHGGVVLPWNPGGWFETADANEDMAIILSAAQPVLICGNYIEIA